MALAQEVLEGFLNDLAEHVRAHAVATNDDERQDAQDDIDRDELLIVPLQKQIAELEAEQKALQTISAMPTP